MRNFPAVLAASLVAIAPIFSAPDADAQSICSNVPASAAKGVFFAYVVAGQTYSYQASGVVGYNSDGCQSDPDGNIVAGTCSPAIGDNSFTCPGLKAFSLVGNLYGYCVQLGSSGTFVAPLTGSLVLYFNGNSYGDNTGSWSVCITPVQQACPMVTGNAAGGTWFGNVEMGETYSYQASAAIGYGPDGCLSDPDGNILAGPCGPAGPSIADGTFTCPSLKAYSLVAKLNGQCLQLGSSGTFVAASSGTLTLYYNDSYCNDNSGFFSACVTPIQVQQICASLPAVAAGGEAFGNVVMGQAYHYRASGAAAYNDIGCKSDPDGNTLAGPCGTAGPSIADDTYTCPGLKALSLVAKVNGQCLQLGSQGTFVAPSTGSLVLYFNDQYYNNDNSGSWDVCITAPPDIDRLVPCSGPVSGGKWKNHGQYVSTIVKVSVDLLEDGLITPAQWLDIVRRAARSACGKK